ncbi:DUF4252 domain-containing protein [Compostibacter hankyongensis]|uniref:DUF4252 domain-containing protein n=1 Tax=Compostibacter hankyongensis TaxID=1007089 RepID=A0ABP8FK27_9BACT
MKKLIISLLIVTGYVSAQAQANTLARFFQRYEKDTSFTIISISPKMFSLFSKVETGDPEADRIMDVAKKLTGLHILANEHTRNGTKLFKEANALLSGEYEELMTVRQQDNDLRFMVKELPNGNIGELVMLIGGAQQFFALSLTGNINLEEVSQISGAMNIDGFDQLKQVKDTRKKK